MTARTVDGNVQQRVFDAIVACGGSATTNQIRDQTGLGTSAIRNAISDLRKRVTIDVRRCHAEYIIPPGTPRPSDLRGQRKQ